MYRPPPTTISVLHLHWAAAFSSGTLSPAITTIPVYLTYGHTFGHLRVFAGAGPSLAFLSAGEILGHSVNMKPSSTALTASFKAGFQLHGHTVLSGEFRPWKSFLEQNSGASFDNLVSVKLGYEFNAPRAKHSSRKKHPNT